MNKVYVLSFVDSGNYGAYATCEKAKQILWENYCEEVDKETREKFLEEDLQTFEVGYITDYGWVEEVTFVNE